MKFLCVLWLWMFLTEFNSTAGEISTQGYSEGNITVTCSHSWASTNRKYFCKDPCEVVLVKSDQSPSGRYTLKDHGAGTFTVTITDLQESDSGIYWCGVDRVGQDTFNKVKLIVLKANTGKMEDVTDHRMMETQTSNEKYLTKPRHSVFASSTSKDSTLSLTSTVFVKESPPEGTKTGAQHNGSSPHAYIFPLPLHYVPYAVAGLAIIVLIVCAVGLVTVCQCRKRVKNSRQVIDRSIYISHHREEKAPDNRLYATMNKSRTKSNDESQSDTIYQNLQFIATQEDAIYENV